MTHTQEKERFLEFLSIQILVGPKENLLPSLLPSLYLFSIEAELLRNVVFILLYNKVHQLRVYRYPLPLGPPSYPLIPPLSVITEP